ncbi:hypothetical protein AX17_007212 [Amanita inopinata Kibby_2008]|nr:hypothetical protein AX17_007212 [Amanita inopinata Kibby_2008]
MTSPLLNALKPHRAEALQRIRTNAFSFIALLLLTYSLPLPSLPVAFKNALTAATTRPDMGVGVGVVYSTRGSFVEHERWSSEWLYGWLCIVEAALASIFLFNIMQGVYALRYPRSPLPPMSSPTKPRPRSVHPSPITPKHPFKITLPKSASIPQKPFTFSPSASTASTSAYPTTPLSKTPSRGSVQYSLPFSLDSVRSTGSSVSGISSTSQAMFPASPSPVVSAWRGKHLVGEVGRPLDGSFLGQLSPSMLYSTPFACRVYRRILETFNDSYPHFYVYNHPNELKAQLLLMTNWGVSPPLEPSFNHTHNHNYYNDTQPRPSLENGNRDTCEQWQWPAPWGPLTAKGPSGGANTRTDTQGPTTPDELHHAWLYASSGAKSNGMGVGEVSIEVGEKVKGKRAVAPGKGRKRKSVAGGNEGEPKVRKKKKARLDIDVGRDEGEDEEEWVDVSMREDGERMGVNDNADDAHAGSSKAKGKGKTSSAKRNTIKWKVVKTAVSTLRSGGKGKGKQTTKTPAPAPASSSSPPKTSTSIGYGYELKPTIWTSSKPELTAILPELSGSKCHNGVTEGSSNLPMVLLDELHAKAVAIGVGGLSEGDSKGRGNGESGKIRLTVIRDFVCSREDLPPLPIPHPVPVNGVVPDAPALEQIVDSTHPDQPLDAEHALIHQASAMSISPPPPPSTAAKGDEDEYPLDQRIPTTLPPEITILSSSCTNALPVILISSRETFIQSCGSQNPSSSSSSSSPLAVECAYVFLGFFKVVRVGVKRVMPPTTSAGPTIGAVSGRVKWSFEFEWIPGNNEGFMSDVHLPWWVPNKGKGKAIDPDLGRGVLGLGQPKLNLLPMQLMHGQEVGSADEAMPRGWLCGRCGKLNQRVMMRHRWCASSVCKGEPLGVGYVVGLESARDPRQTPIVLPFNECPAYVDVRVADWSDGMRTLAYRPCPVPQDQGLDQGQDGEGSGSGRGKDERGVVKHVFTCNLPELQREATTLFEQIQQEICLQKKVGDAGPFFKCQVTESRSDIGNEDKCGAFSSLTWRDAPKVVHDARDLLLFTGRNYAEEPMMVIDRLVMVGWVSSGTRKVAFETVNTDRGSVVLMCLGNDLVLTVTPKWEIPPPPPVPDEVRMEAGVPFVDVGGMMDSGVMPMPDLDAMIRMEDEPLSPLSSDVGDIDAGAGAADGDGDGDGAGVVATVGVAGDRHPSHQHVMAASGVKDAHVRDGGSGLKLKAAKGKGKDKGTGKGKSVGKGKGKGKSKVTSGLEVGEGEGEEKGVIVLTLVHGDAVVFSGCEYEYSIKRLGTSILLVGSMAPREI